MNKTKIIVCMLGIAFGSNLRADDDVVDFGRDVRPILSDTCYKCHGPDEEHREAGLRLDLADGGIQSVIDPDDLAASELYQRVISDDEDLIMPPVDSGRTLTDEQKSILRRWVEQGADWERHWSFVSPTKKELSDSDSADWSKTPIDSFIHERLKKNNLHPNGLADRRTLIRRVSFDLTGLPPTNEVIDEFLNDPTEDWYEKLVDRLLDSPEYGEHMARYWLDAARYGDTHGLHLDNYREMWLYRDWVIQAFNENKSYRDFLVEQLAGDLLEQPTEDQLIATGFNRAHVTTNEGGSIDEEVYVRNVVDRVSTTGTVFMGLTVGCAQCHDHKFDPISQQEFYQLFAFFNSLDGKAMDGNVKDHAPVLRRIDDDGKKKIAALELNIKSAEESIKTSMAAIKYTEPETKDEADTKIEAETDTPVEFVWVDDKLPIGAKKEGNWGFVGRDKFAPYSGEKSREVKVKEFSQHFYTGSSQLLRVQKGDVFFAYIYLDPENLPEEIMLQFNDGSWEHRVYWGENKINFGAEGTPGRLRVGDLPKAGEWVRLEVPVETVGFEKLSLVNGIAFSQFGGHVYWDAAGVVSKINQNPNRESLNAWLEDQVTIKGVGLPNPIKDIVNKKVAERDEKQQKQLLDYFLANVHPEHSPVIQELTKKRDDLKNELKKTTASFPTTLVWKELNEAKPAFVLLRGEYDKHGDPVERLTPDALPAFSEDLPRNRLGLAKWLVDPKHPLTSRVAVNRFWQQLFGNGIVETSDDFGAQGSVPSHPELLDWLAVDFVENDWDIKRLLKLMVSSRTYRQSSLVTPEKLRLDPNNRLLSRGSRLRLDAEMLRDQALSVSGLLVKKIGGPSVKPPQPDGLWFVVGYSGSNTVRFKGDKGREKVHRRSLYTFWKRTSPPPQMSTFDAPSRESCNVRRERTNTPLQALLLMNEPQYIESARQLAQVTLELPQEQETPNDVSKSRIEFMFGRAICRPPTDQERQLLLDTLEQNLVDYRSAPAEAKKLIAIGETAASTEIEATELAAWTMLANLIMNMDEFVTKN